MIKIKRIISFFISIVVILVIILNFDFIKEKFLELTDLSKRIEIKEGNGYQKEYDFISLQQVENYIPNNYDDLINIFYSVLNQGWDEFTFYCPSEYVDCLDDVADISFNDVLLSEINNYVHPYNGYSSIKTLYDDTGKITIQIVHIYTDDEISLIDNTINEIIRNNVNEKMTDIEKIKALHDYIINNTTYDTKKDESIYDSSRMTGLLYEHYAVCSGYTDVMAVMLEKLGIKNFRVASGSHIWNAVYVNNSWLHLDLTWDDPVVKSGKDILDHSYFLIDNDTLFKLDEVEKQHEFNKNFYIELQSN